MITKNIKYLFLFILTGHICLNGCKRDDNNNDISTETINIGLIIPMTSYPEYSQEIIDGANFDASINAFFGIFLVPYIPALSRSRALWVKEVRASLMFSSSSL